MVDIPFPVVPEANADLLTEKQLVDYENHRHDFVRWLLVRGKDPDEYTGYSVDTVKRTAYRCAKFDRDTWQSDDGYSIPLTQPQAESYLEQMAYEGHSGTHLHKIQHSLRRYFKWLHYDRGGELWEPDANFRSNGRQNPPDFLSREERKKIRQAALDYGSIPAYSTVSPDERQEWKKYVSKRLRKPLEEISPEDWKQVNGWKYTSMTWTSLDAGLRPSEVSRATINWVDVDNRLLRIPKTESAKGHENWTVSVTDRTADALGRWIEERENYDLYDDTNKLWLTREGNPYASKELRRLLIRLCDEAGIETENRKMSWYSIRHSVGTYMAREEDLAAAQAQLRHQSPQTTMKYDQAPVEDRRSALDRMG